MENNTKENIPFEYFENQFTMVSKRFCNCENIEFELIFEVAVSPTEVIIKGKCHTCNSTTSFPASSLKTILILNKP